MMFRVVNADLTDADAAIVLDAAPTAVAAVVAATIAPMRGRLRMSSLVVYFLSGLARSGLPMRGAYAAFDCRVPLQ